MELLPALGLIGLLLVKEAGVPVPVPGDLLVLGAGIAAAGAGLAAAGAPAVPAPLLLAAILAAGFVGGSLQFALVRGAFREPLVRLLTRFGVPRERLDGLAGWLRQRGALGVAVARATPGVRVGATAASGLAALPFGAFLPGLVAGNTLFVGGHFALGYVAGPAALALIAATGGVALGVGAFVILAVIGAGAWRVLRRRRAAASAASAADWSALPLAAPAAGSGATEDRGLPRDIPSLATWAEAACPACLAISLVRGRGA
jgi:membrane protein DedA with SNARE-associated domain